MLPLVSSCFVSLVFSHRLVIFLALVFFHSFFRSLVNLPSFLGSFSSHTEAWSEFQFQNRMVFERCANQMPDLSFTFFSYFLWPLWNMSPSHSPLILLTFYFNLWCFRRLASFFFFKIVLFLLLFGSPSSCSFSLLYVFIFPPPYLLRLNHLLLHPTMTVVLYKTVSLDPFCWAKPLKFRALIF